MGIAKKQGVKAKPVNVVLLMPTPYYIAVIPLGKELTLWITVKIIRLN